MTEQLETLQERRQSGQPLIEHMLKERNQLFSLLLEVSTEDAADELAASIGDLEEFVQVLVDYVAAGHFGLYQRIAEGNERRKAISDLAVKIYPIIERTTEIALAFDEKYNQENKNRNLDNLQMDLSRLGEELTRRFELEDQLINVIMGKQ